MPTIVVSVLLAALAVAFLCLRPEDDEPRSAANLWIALGVMAPALLAALFVLEPAAFGQTRVLAALAGIAVAAAAEWFGPRTRPAAALALGALAGSLATLAPESARDAAAWSVVAGAGVLAAAVPTARCGIAAFAVAGVALANRVGDTPLGSLVALAVLAAIMASEIAAHFSKVAWARPVATFVSAGLVLALLSYRGQPEDSVWQAACLGLVVGALWTWVAKGQGDLVLRGIAAALLGVAMAAVAASLGQGVAIAVAGLAAGAFLASQGPTAWLAVAGPVLAIAFFRILREQGRAPSLASTELDSYVAVLGLLVGAMIAVLPNAWRRAAPSSQWMAAAGAALLVAAMAGASPVLGIGFGFRAVSGLLIGLGIGTLLDLLRGDRGTAAVGALVGVSALTLLAIPGFAPFTDLVRADKIQVLRWAFVAYGAFALGLMIASALGKSKEQQPA